MPSELSDEGGQGEPVRVSRSDLVMERVAIKRPHLYGLTQEKREALMRRTLRIAIDPNTKDREVISAGKNVLIMQSQEMEQQKIDKGIPDTAVVMPFKVYIGFDPSIAVKAIETTSS